MAAQGAWAKQRLERAPRLAAGQQNMACAMCTAYAMDTLEVSLELANLQSPSGGPNGPAATFVKQVVAYSSKLTDGKALKAYTEYCDTMSDFYGYKGMLGSFFDEHVSLQEAIDRAASSSVTGIRSSALDMTLKDYGYKIFKSLFWIHKQHTGRGPINDDCPAVAMYKSSDDDNRSLTVV